MLRRSRFHCGKDREGERDADDVFPPADGRHHRVVLGLLAHQHADHSVLTRDRASRLQRRGVDPLTVRRGHERRPRAAECALADRGLLLLADQTRDPHDDEEEQRRRRTDQDRQIAADVAEVLDHHHAGREQRGEREQPEPTPRQPWLDVGRALRQRSHRPVQRGRAPQDVERRPPRFQDAAWLS